MSPEPVALPPYVSRPLGAYLLETAARRPDAVHCEVVAENGSTTRVTNAQSVVKTKDGSTQFRDLNFTDKDNR